ncbi:leucine-rich repeat domain-containing protein [Methanomassiliicoccus luminyensis]|uniref:leucine-rich repeat domain-containing protein n=1 Tax=Methanomassiliicoccus luminyensis TaxID=1080712 RepID=UPI000366C189|nr:leucine-rich repeat domain-containing protein [Methanomassiliicoccus luminyensis]
MPRRSLVFAFLVLAMLVLSVVHITVPAEGLSPSEYASPGGVYKYRTSGATSADYASEILGLTGGSGTVFIQSALEGYPLRTVTSLSGCTADTLVIPSSITSISDTAFSDCADLERVYFLGDRPTLGDDGIPDGVEIYVLEGAEGWGSLPAALDLMIYSDADSSISYYVIDGKAVVHGLVAGTKISIPSEVSGVPVKSIGDEAFRGTGISSLIVGEGVESIGVRAFYDCVSLLTVAFPESLRVICDEAFRNSNKLTDVDLRNTEFIGFESFRDCHSFTEIMIPDTVKCMSGGAFYICNSVEKVVVGSGISAIEERVFGYGSSISDLTMKGDITSVGGSAFYRCASLGSISLSKVTDIGPYAFYEASSLAHIDLGRGLVSIGEGTFWDCKALTSIRIPDTVTTLGSSAFSECTSLQDIYFDGNMPLMGEDVFYRTDVTVHYLSIHSESWQAYGGKAVADRGEDTDPEPPWAIAAASSAAILGIVLYAIWRRGRR